MDIQFWVWVAIIVLTFLARAMKKKKEGMGQGPMDAPTDDDGIPKTISFEDLLREIQESKKPASPAPKPVPARTVEVVNYEEEEEQPRYLETIKPDYRSEDAIYETYEKAKKEAFSRPSLEETSKLGDTIVRFDAFGNYKKQDNKRHISRYLKDFRSPEGLKKAFVMSEILKRKF